MVYQYQVEPWKDGAYHDLFCSETCSVSVACLCLAAICLEEKDPEGRRRRSQFFSTATRAHRLLPRVSSSSFGAPRKASHLQSSIGEVNLKVVINSIGESCHSAAAAPLKTSAMDRAVACATSSSSSYLLITCRNKVLRSSCPPPRPELVHGFSLTDPCGNQNKKRCSRCWWSRTRPAPSR